MISSSSSLSSHSQTQFVVVIIVHTGLHSILSRGFWRTAKHSRRSKAQSFTMPNRSRGASSPAGKRSNCKEGKNMKLVICNTVFRRHRALICLRLVGFGKSTLTCLPATAAEKGKAVLAVEGAAMEPGKESEAALPKTEAGRTTETRSQQLWMQ